MAFFHCGDCRIFICVYMFGYRPCATAVSETNHRTDSVTDSLTQPPWWHPRSVSGWAYLASWGLFLFIFLSMWLESVSNSAIGIYCLYGTYSELSPTITILHLNFYLSALCLIHLVLWASFFLAMVYHCCSVPYPSSYGHLWCYIVSCVVVPGFLNNIAFVNMIILPS
jgi:hypothetical protein